MVEGKTAIQRDLDRVEKWANKNIMKFIKNMQKLGWNYPMQQYKLGGSSAEKRFGSPGRKQAGQQTAVCPSSKEGQLCP